MTFHAVRAHGTRGAACSPRKRSARRAARDVSARLVLPFVLLQMVVSLVFPCGALALSPNDQGVLWGPTSLGGGNSGIVVSATNNFDAALWAIGRWDTKIQLTHEMFVKLSNEGSGGHFYELATYFHSYSEVGSPNWPNAAAVEGYAISLGPDNVWLASVPSSLISDARRDYNTVLSGGSLGGGGSGGGVTGDYVTYTMPLMFSPLDEGGQGYGSYYLSFGDSTMRYTTNLTNYTKNSSNQSLLPPALTVRIDKEVFAGLSDSDLDNTCVMFRIHTSNDSAVYCNLFHASGGFTALSSTSFVSKTVTNDGVTAGPFSGSFYRRGDVGFDGTLRRRFIQFSNSSSSLKTYEYRNGVLYLNVTDGASLDNWATKNDTTDAGYAFAGFFGTGGGGGGGGGNNWPTDDPTPTPDPPEVPGPSDDPVVEPDPPDLPNPVEYPVSDPYTPDPDPPSNPVVTYDPNPTGEPTDYRPWLNAILVLLRKINTTLSDGFGDLRGWLTNHCDHIREQIHSDSVDLGLHVQTAIQNGFISFERWLQGTFAGYFLDEIDYLLGENFRELEGYLYDLFHWLASQFDFTFGGTNYDDTSVIYWLRRIYARLGGGAPNPGDDGTVDDGFDWWAWLLGLITDALGGIITDFVGDVGGFLATLADVFPFSIPGDIVAYLTLLDAARETPRFVVTIPAVQGWWQSFDYEIDLSPFDDAMGVVRGMYLIYWGLILVMKTDWLGGVFDFATRAVVQFFDKITGGAYSA